MKTKSIRIPTDIISALSFVGKKEKVEESTAMRKLMRIGFETYIGNLYKEGKVTLREAAKLLKVNQVEAMDLFIEKGIKGNLDVSDVMVSMEKFVLQ
tara:strand:+ start:776 stop:1066 length:291 start_codon:yes stop_codon:yes gene_type:complete